MTIEQAAHQAGRELKITAVAFDGLRKRYLSEIMGAQGPDEAWRAVLALRALNYVATTLYQAVETGKMEEHYEEQK